MIDRYAYMNNKIDEHPDGYFVLYPEYEKLEKENERLNKLCEETEDRLLLGVFLEKRLEKENEDLKKEITELKDYIEELKEIEHRYKNLFK